MKTSQYVLILTGLITCFTLAYCKNIGTNTPPLSQFEQKLTNQGLVDISKFATTIKVHLVYSTTNNFLGEDVYGDLEKCYLQPGAAIKLSNAQALLKSIKPNYSLLVFDGVRPRSVQYKMWDIVKGTPQQSYVANPKRGSIHNYGCAVDLTIVDDNNNMLDMGTEFDYFGKLAEPRYEDKFIKIGKLSLFQISNRLLLRRVMTNSGFYILHSEWWHFDAFPKAEVRKRFVIIE